MSELAVDIVEIDILKQVAECSVQLIRAKADVRLAESRGGIVFFETQLERATHRYIELCNEHAERDSVLEAEQQDFLNFELEMRAELK